MQGTLEGKERTLGKVFSSDFRYVIPDYQRPYAWEIDQVEKLIDDLYDSFCASQNTYFLGSLVLVETEDGRCEIVDGQQRLSTLVMLLSTLICNLPKEERTSKLEELLYDSDGYFADASKKPRIVLRNKDQLFFEQVQTLQLDALMKGPLATPTESQQRIRQNVAFLNQRVRELFMGDTKRHLAFIDYLLSHCYIVAVTSRDRGAAFRMFSVLNSRGLDLSAIDLIKAQLFQDLTEQEREDCIAKWDDAEATIGSQGMNDALTHLRFILTPTKARSSVYEETSALIAKNFTARQFIEEQFLPATAAYGTLKFSNEAFKTEESVRASLRWLKQISNTDWMPAAMLYLMTKGPNSDDAPIFFTKLERLAAYLQTVGIGVNNRLKRYGAIINEMKASNEQLFSEAPSLELSSEEQSAFLAVLRGELYALPSYRCKYPLLRLNELLAEGPSEAKAGNGSVSVEHVLPQTVPEGSEWARLWTEEKRAFWQDRLANLVLLTRRMNSAARNYDYNRKRKEYFAGGAVASFALTASLADIPAWTNEAVEKRQEELIGRLSELWKLEEREPGVSA